MRRVILESPYTADDELALWENVYYARQAVLDSLGRGEAPIASHLLYTQEGILRDADVGQRSMGILAGHAWIPCADAMVVYIDRGVSSGMQQGMDRAKEVGLSVELRKILE